MVQQVCILAKPVERHCIRTRQHRGTPTWMGAGGLVLQRNLCMGQDISADDNCHVTRKSSFFVSIYWHKTKTLGFALFFGNELTLGGDLQLLQVSSKPE